MAQQKPGTSKHSKTTTELRTSHDTKEIDSIIPPKARTATMIILLAVSLLIFFGKVLSSEKTFNADDNVASESILPYLNAAQAAGDAVPQWIPNIFCGMPSYASLLSTGSRTYDVLYHTFNIIRNAAKAIGGGSDGMFMLFHYFLFGLGIYLFLRLSRNTSHLVSFFGAVAAVYSTWILTYAMIGHNTKVFSIMTFPYILLCLEKLRSGDKSWSSMLLWSLLLGVAIHFLLEGVHPQMAFYIILSVAIYFLSWFIGDILRKQSVVPSLRTGLITIVVAGLAFAMSADRYMAAFNYNPYSIRGTSPLVERSEEGVGTKLAEKTSKGLDWEYATSYSFSPGEMITFLVPGWYGFGKLPYSGPEVGGQERTITLYWGQMITTDAANYTGIIIFFLSLIGIVTLWKKDRLIPPLAVISLFGLLFSFGGTFPILYRLMYEYFPFTNQFRAPMMALVMMQFAFPLIAALTLEKILTVRASNDKPLADKLKKFAAYGMYAAAGLFVIFLIGRGAIGDSLREGIAKSGKFITEYQGFQDHVVSTALNDALICMIIAVAALALLWMYMKGSKISATAVVLTVLTLTFIDQWRIGMRPFEVVEKAEMEQTFRDHDYVQFVKKDSSLHRILDMNETTSNLPAFWMEQTVAGYHAAKIRRFQDVVDVTGNANGQVIFNPFMWSLLNTKYIIADGAVDSVQGRMRAAFVSAEQKQTRDGKPSQTVVWENTQVLPRAFFVNRYEVKQPLAILEAMRDGAFTPRDVLYFDEEPSGIANVTPLDSAAMTQDNITITSYQNEKVEMKSKTSAERLVFFSDTWYPNWQLTIDGTPAKFYRANYSFRAFTVPAGEHTIRWEYHDEAYETGRSISLGANIIAIIGLAVGIGLSVRKKNKPTESPEETTS